MDNSADSRFTKPNGGAQNKSYEGQRRTTNYENELLASEREHRRALATITEELERISLQAKLENGQRRRETTYNATNAEQQLPTTSGVLSWRKAMSAQPSTSRASASNDSKTAELVSTVAFNKKQHEDLEQQVYKLRHELEQERQRTQYLEKQLFTMDYICMFSFDKHRVVWTISKFFERMADAKQRNTSLIGPLFAYKSYGYKLLLQANLNGAEHWRGSNMTVGLKLLSGPYDNVLQWPCRLSSALLLLDQSSNAGPGGRNDFYIPWVVEWERSEEKCVRTVVIPHSVLYSGRYIHDDTIFLELRH